MAASFNHRYGPRFVEACAHALTPFSQQNVVDGTSSSDKLVDEIRLMLDRGLDPNCVDDNGVSLLGHLGRMVRGSSPAGVAIARALLEAGGNPMLHDGALGRAIDHTYSSQLVTETLLWMARKEAAGQGLRDANGGNSLHYLAQHNPELAAWQLEEDVYAIKDGDTSLLFFTDAMIHAPRERDQATPLGVLWQGSVQNWDPHRVEQAWRMTGALLARGADPFVLDGEGRCVADVIEQWVRDGLATDTQGVWRHIEAATSLRRLDANTPAAGQVRQGPRL